MKARVFILFSFVIFLSCQQGGETLGSFTEMLKISNEMAKKYSEQISFSISNSKSISINLTNSKKNNLSNPEKGKYALELAFYVYDHLNTINNFSEISINFKIRSEVFIFYSERTIASFDNPVVDLAYLSKKRISDSKTL